MNNKETDNIIRHVFVQWMASRDLLDEWMIEALKHDEDTVLNRTSRIKSIITETLHWESTERGHAYWRQVHNEWRNIATELGAGLQDE